MKLIKPYRIRNVSCLFLIFIHNIAFTVITFKFLKDHIYIIDSQPFWTNKKKVQNILGDNKGSCQQNWHTISLSFLPEKNILFCISWFLFYLRLQLLRFLFYFYLPRNNRFLECFSFLSVLVQALSPPSSQILFNFLSDWVTKTILYGKLDICRYQGKDQTKIIIKLHQHECEYIVSSSFRFSAIFLNVFHYLLCMVYNYVPSIFHETVF